jgi:DNA-repair protein XRCC3
MASSSSSNTLPSGCERVTFGCPLIDNKIGGGLPLKSVTELVGEAGAGKTQLCLQQSFLVQLPDFVGGLSGSTYYIYTDGRFPYRRYDQLMRCMVNRFSCVVGDDWHWHDQIRIEQIFSPSKFIAEFNSIENVLSRQACSPMPVKLIVVDSITSLFRDFANDRSDYRQRMTLLTTITHKLKRWSNTFNLAVVVTNQVVSYMPTPNNSQPWEGMVTSGEQVRPATALQKTNYVGGRLFMSKEPHGDRHLTVAIRGFLNLFPVGRIRYVIKEEGVFGCADR